MRGIVICPHKPAMVQTEFEEEEQKRMKEVMTILKTIDITTINFHGNIIYSARSDYSKLPPEGEMGGMLIEEENIFIGDAVILGIDENTGEDLSCSLRLNELDKMILPALIMKQ